MARFARGKIAGLLGALALLVAVPARADFEIIYDAALSNPGAGTFTYDGFFNNTANTANGLPNELLTTGSFGTVYDIPGLTGFQLNSAFTGSFDISSAATGKTAVQTGPNDTALLPNVTVTWKLKESLTSPNGTTFVGLFTVTSSFHFINEDGQYTGQLTKGPGATGVSGLPSGSIGKLVIPGVPEPASVVMMGIGTLGVGALTLFRRRNISA